MTSPHSGYPHQVPAYYQPMPPSQGYATHSLSPGHSPNPHHPHINSHHPALHHHPPSSGRINGRGGPNSYASRTKHGHGHHPQGYHPDFHPPPPLPIPQHQPYPRPHPLVHAPHPQHPHLHLQHPAKFPHPHTPPYPYPSPTSLPAAPYSPSWLPHHLPHQPRSPLPEQFFIPLPRDISPIVAQAEQMPKISIIEAPVVPKEGDVEQSTEEQQPSTETQVPQVPDSSTSFTPPPSAVQPRPQSAATTPSIVHIPLPVPTTTMHTMGSITGNNPARSPTHSVSSTRSRSHNPSSSFTSIAIWSRRPGDPSKAPGIIISPHARPPEDIVSKALDVPTPPPSPSKSVPVPLPVEDEVEAEEAEGVKDVTPIPVGTQQVDSTISSSAVTEVTDAPTLPGSPISTNTSISVTGGSPTKEHTVSTATITGPPSVDGNDTAGEKPKSTITSEPSESLVISTPGPAPVITKPGVPKSWASLFSPSPSTSSTAHTSGSSMTTHPQRSALPTSSQVGISIPAPSSAPAVPVTPAKKSELLSLLINGPGGLGAVGVAKIRPRGLINSGNMCFANAVLQVLVYCAPFQRLFVELGHMLIKEPPPPPPPPAAPSTSTSTSGVSVVPNGVASTNGLGKPAKSQTPFIDATVEFLNEFVEEDKERTGGQKKKGMTSDGFSSGRGGKGKEKEAVSDADVDGTSGDEWPESFLPSYVYEAMKEKKRFENMRGGQQEDAEEFLGFYLDTLEEELLWIQNSLAPPPLKASKQQQEAVEEKEEPEPREEDGWLEVGKKNRMIVTRTIKAVESPITRIFGGKFKSTLKAPGQKDSVLIEDWRSLRLDIQRDSIHTIQDALTQLTQPQSIQMTNSSRPGVMIDANQKVLVEALPPVLVLHVKRFCYDTAVGGVVKVMKQVRFEPELEIGSDMMAPGKRPQSTKYRLFGAIYHHGHSASGGHYTLDVLHPNRYPGTKLREGWVRIDDELVSDVRSDDVFDAWEKDEMRNAYLLFYRRIRSM